MAADGRSPALPAVERSTMSKVRRRLLSLLFLAFILNYVDRTNLGVAQASMSADLGLSAAAFGLGAGIFFIGYAVFEVPSNLILHRVGARVWIARIMATWGIVATAMAFVTNEQMFYLLRFLLGVAEAGFVPGILLYLRGWAPARYRARMIAGFLVALPLASVIGAPLTGWLMQHSLLGLESWRLAFFLEGVPTILLAGVVLWRLTSRPVQATWLTDAERDWLMTSIERDDAADAASAGHVSSPWRALGNPRVLAMCAIYFATLIPLYSMAFFMPSIIKAMTGGTLGSLGVGLLTAIPYVFAAIGLVLISRSSDRRGERRLHFSATAAVGGVGLVVTAVCLGGQPALALAGFCLAAVGCISSAGAFWSEVPITLGGAAAAAGIALVNTVGNIGGFVAPFLSGAILDAFGGPARGGPVVVLVGAAFLLAAAALMALVGSRGTRATGTPTTGSAVTDRLDTTIA